MEARLNEIVQLIREHLTQHRCDDGIEQAAFIGKAAVNIPLGHPSSQSNFFGTGRGVSFFSKNLNGRDDDEFLLSGEIGKKLRLMQDVVC